MLYLFCDSTHGILQINFVLSLKIHIMIQANELRIGNWVKVKGTNNAITVSFPLHNELAEDWYSFLNAIEPIPLTPEILEKCNCIKDTNTPYTTSVFGIDFQFNSDFIHFYWDGEYLFYNGFKIQHLHQLQNIYFALSNTELNIEL